MSPTFSPKMATCSVARQHQATPRFEKKPKKLRAAGAKIIMSCKFLAMADLYCFKVMKIMGLDDFLLSVHD